MGEQFVDPPAPAAARGAAWPTRKNRFPTVCRSIRAASISTRTCCSQGVGIRFNGVEKTNVIEYSVSEGWICVPAGRSLDRFGQPMTVKLKGVVEPYYEGDEAADDAARASDEKGPGADAEA